MNTESKKKSQKLPKWFEGDVYPEGAEVTNPFSGESYKLNNIELSLYDFIIGAQMVFDYNPGMRQDKLIREFQNALTWFRNNNPKAYYVLLDQMRKLIWKLYNENRISMEVAIELLDKYYE